MKKLLCILLALSLTAALFGCGSSAPKQTDPIEEPAPAKTDFTFDFKTTTIAMNMLAAPVIEALGEPRTYTEAASCAFEGLDKTYYYGGFYLTTYPDGDNDRVYQLWFADDSVETRQGIRIGSSLAEVQEGCPNAEWSGDTLCKLRGEKTVLTIMLEGGYVTSVQYMADIMG